MDLITHVKDLNAMVSEAVEIIKSQDGDLARYFTIDAGGKGVTFNVGKIPVVYSNDGQTLCLVNGISREVIEQSTTISVIGECIDGEYVFDEGGKEVYEGVYDTKPRMVGGMEFIPPYKIGVFA